MQSIRIGSNADILSPPKDQPASPLNIPAEGGKPPQSAPEALKGTVSEAEALKAVEGSKISTIMPLSGNSPAMGSMGNSVPVGGMLDSTLAVELMDALLPSLLVIVMKSIGATMKKADLQLTAKEKITIAPILQKCLDQLMINFNSPWAALGVTLSVIYGAKLAEKGFVQMLDQKAEQAEKKDIEKKTVDAPPATVIQMDKKPEGIASNPVRVVNDNWEPTNEQIYEGMKRYKKSKVEVVQRLKKEYMAGTLDKFLRRKPFK